MKRCQHLVVLPLVAAVLALLVCPLALAAPATPAPASASTAKTPPVATAAPVPDAPLLADQIRQLMQDRKFVDALKAIDDASRQPGAPVDYLAWLKGRALFLDGKLDEAIAVFEGVEKQFPKSPWVRRARFAKALTFARKGDFRAAELIYRGEAEYLLSTDRKQEIADLYLEFADTYFKPPKDEQKPDYAKALEFYKKALEVGPKPQKQTEVELLVAECQQNLGKLDEAAGLYEKFSKEHGDSPLDIEARFRLGQCRLAQGRFKDARRVWQDLLAKYPNSKSERIPETAFQLSRTWGIPPAGSTQANQSPNQPASQPAPQQQAQVAVPQPPQPPAPPATTENLTLGVAALESFIERFPTHKLASRAHLDIAASYMAFGRYEDAVAALKRFLADDRYKDREETPEGRQLLGRAYQLQKKFPDALTTWHDYLAKHPTHKAWSQVQREIVNTEFLMARDKMEAKQYEAAVKLFNEFLAKYPLDARNPEILYFFGAMDHRQEKWDAAIADWQRLVSKYPGTEWASRGQYMIAETLETHLGKLEEALEAYRKVTSGSFAGPAQQAVARLTAKRLTVATDRVFRSDEKPKLALVTRNLETVTVRAYKVDLETYFRKMHLAQGVESLDIALISPDKTFDFAVPKYAKHQELESAVEVPLPGDAKAGVMAVTVSSKTHEATSLLIQSDLDIIVKSSRNEVFVFAENMLTGKPWPEVKLLISNGKQVFAEGVTGKDGVFRAELKELKDAADVRVFATSGGHVASNVVGLQGIGVAQGLADKGYLYTDRPAYRAGDLVHLRGLLRRAAQDAYVIDKGKQYTLEVFDGRNRLVHQTKVTLGDFGSFAADFTLPAGSPQGQYRFSARDEAGKTFAGTFLVQEYVLEPIRLVIDTPRRVYYRGEEIEGTIRAAYYYGAPLAGHEVRYQLADDRLYTATTDAKGEIRFKLPTREFSETQVLPLVVTLPERNLQTAANFVLSCQGFSIGVSTVRPVYVAGETFEATIKATDAEGKPIAQKLTLSVLERTIVEGKVGERLVEKHALETAADGSVRKTLKLEKGGRYTLRAEGSDRFKNVISGQGLVQVSDEEDLVRLRILADKHTFKVGDTAKVQLYWREDPALALVTFQGARVLEYKLVQLAKGANALDIPMTAKLAPNFELAVALMTNARPDLAPHPSPATRHPPLLVRRFHAASSPFAVERDLRVSVTTKRKGNAQGTPKPGEEIEVTVTTTDPQGKPVAAEVSLAMVERALLERFSFPVPAIQDFFRGGLRRPAVRTTASIVFAYHPATKPIDPQLLAEQDREELAKEETLSRQAAAGDTAGLLGRVSVETLPGLDAVIARGPARDVEDVRRLIERIDTAEVAESDVMSMIRLNQRSPGEVRQALEEILGESQSGRLHFSVGVDSDLGVLGSITLDEQSVQWGNGTYGAAGDANGPNSGPQFAGVAVRSLYDPRGAASQLARGNFAANAGNVRLGGLGGGQGGGFGGGRFMLQDGRPVAMGLPSAGGQMFGARVIAKADMPLARDGRVINAEDFAAEYGIETSVTPAGLPPLQVQDTGYWNPAIVTGADGKAVLSVTVPERSTSWNLVAKGITHETLAGESTGDLVVKKDLFGQLKLPMAFTDGDEAEVSVSVHNDAIEKGQIEVILKTTIGGRSVEEKKTIDVKAKGIHDLTFKVALKRPESGGQTSVPAKKEKSAAETTPEESRDLIGRVQVEIGNLENFQLDESERKKIAEIRRLIKLIERDERGDPEVKRLIETEIKKMKEAKPATDANVVFELTVAPVGRIANPSYTDVVRRTVPLVPYGMPVYATASGSATIDTTVWVEAPKDMTLEGPSLQILVGPTVERSLLDIVLGAAPMCQIDVYRVASGLDAATSDLLASIGLQKLVGGSREAGTPQAQALDGRVRAGIALLVSSQMDDGGWSWTGVGRIANPSNPPNAAKSDRYVSARAVWGLSLAKAAGYPVPDDCFNKAIGFLKNQMAATGNSDYESSAILLHALSAAGQGDFAVANRLYRDRPSLSAAALAYLALAFVEMDRKATAGELLALLGQKNLDDAALKRSVSTGALPWSHSAVELRALYALGLQRTSPKSPKAKELADWLLAHRVGHRWSPDKATGPAALALCEWFSDARFQGEHYRLTVFVNDVQAQVLEIDDSSLTRTIDVPAKLLKSDGLTIGPTLAKQRIQFQITGRGRYTYQCILGGFVPAEKLKKTTDEWRVVRTHEPAPLELDGREIPRGFGVLEGSYTSFRNPLTQLPVGRRGQVELQVWRQNVLPSVPEEQLEYLVITEPIPCGATVIEKSVQGGFERFEIGPGQITFYVGTRRFVGTIHYELNGYLPGSYHAAPTVIRNAYRPEQLAVAAPKPLAVLPQGAASADKYDLTPQELYELGKRLFQKHDAKTAGGHLTGLVEKWPNLRGEVYKDAVQMLLDVHLELGPPAKIVRYFEIIKEKWPGEEIPFAKIMKIASAYHDMGEYERSYLVFRATVESSFFRESGVAGFLDGQGEFLRSVDVMGRLLQEYPPEPYVAAAGYALAQRVYAKAPAAGEDPKLREKKVNRVDLVRRAWRMLEGFLTAYPDDPAADQAAFAAANALLEMKSYDQAAAASNRYASRYPKSDLLDSYWYIMGYCDFASGRHDEALQMCRRVAETKRIDRRTGAETESVNKWQAIYILGQVFHSDGKAAEAIQEYRRVEDRFADAKEAIQYFLRKAIELPEVTAVKPGTPAEVELKFRNVPSCDVKVYTIDLLKFSLLKRNLGGITQINLAGIRPLHEATVKLGEGKDYADKQHKLALPLKDEGAYLVVCRGEDLHTSGLVLVTPLAVEVQEDAASGRVRATVKNSLTGRYLNDVQIKVIGTRNSEFTSGATDLRGVFVADGIQGTSTVIARAEPKPVGPAVPAGGAGPTPVPAEGIRYAFFRGQTDLVPAAPAAATAAPAAQSFVPAPADAKGMTKARGMGRMGTSLLEGVERMNLDIQGRQVEQLKQMQMMPSKGVEAQKAY